MKPSNPLESKTASLKSRRHMRYLDRLIRTGRSPVSIRRDPRKRSDWAKFCHVCGADISEKPRKVVTCGKNCAEIREEQKYKRSADRQAADRRRSWRRRIRAAGKGLR